MYSIKALKKWPNKVKYLEQKMLNISTVKQKIKALHFSLKSTNSKAREYKRSS